MWNWFNCYLSGRHDFGVSCEPGAIFLRCSHCGRRSPGWAVDQQRPQSPAPSTRQPVQHAARIASHGVDHTARAAVQPRGRQLAHAKLTLRARAGDNTSPCPSPASPKKISNSNSTAARRRCSSTRV